MFQHNPLHEELEKKSRHPHYKSRHELIRFYKEKEHHQTLSHLKCQLLLNLGDWLIALGNPLKSKALNQPITLNLKD